MMKMHDAIGKRMNTKHVFEKYILQSNNLNRGT